MSLPTDLMASRTTTNVLAGLVLGVNIAIILSGDYRAEKWLNLAIVLAASVTIVISNQARTRPKDSDGQEYETADRSPERIFDNAILSVLLLMTASWLS